MQIQEFSRRIAELTAHLDALRAPSVGVGAPSADGSDVATVEALAEAVEELRVAEEELRRLANAPREAAASAEREIAHEWHLFHDAPMAFLVTDLNGTIRRANLAAAELLAIRPEFLRGKPLVVFIGETSRPAFRSELARSGLLLRAEYELQIRTRRGAEFPATVVVSPLRDERGVRIALLWSFRDDTDIQRARDRLRTQNLDLERRVAERTGQLQAELRTREELLVRAHSALAEAEASPSRHLAEVVQELDAILWTSDPLSGRFTRVGGRVDAILGLDPQSWLDDPAAWFDRVHPDDRDYVAEVRSKVIRSGKPAELEYRIIASDGRAVWFRESIRVAEDPEGRPVELRGLLVDISRRKKAERHLYHARKELADELRDLKHLHQLSTRLTSLELGPTLREILGAALSIQGAEKGAIWLYQSETDDLAPAASVGLSPEFLGNIGTLGRGLGACGRVLASGEWVVIPDILEDAEHAAFNPACLAEGFRAVFSHPLYDREGRFLGTLCSLFAEPHRPSDRQVEMVSQYAELAATAIVNARRFEEARASDRRKEDFLTTLAHELRNPLAAATAAAELLGRDDVPLETRRDAAETVRRQLTQMSRLVEDLLDSARVARGKVSIDPRPIPVAEALRDAVEAIRPAAEAKGLTVESWSDPACPPVLADPTRLAQILGNLTANAVRYTDRGGRVALSAEPEGDEVRFAVRDTGVGIAPDELDAIFELFTQLHPASDHERGGLGLGLALVRGLVERHGGRVEAASAGPGLGSEFTVWLPAAEPSEPPAEPTEPSDAPAGPLRILVVDDHPDTARMLARLLESQGHRVESAPDAASALALATSASHPFDAAILDRNLPDLDGESLASRLRALGSARRLIALSGQSPPADSNAFDVHLLKPIRLPSLLDALNPRPEAVSEP